MPKQGEIDYVKNLDAAAREHARRKPFSDPRCGQYLLNLGVVFSLLPPPPARILDLGVGTGWTSAFLAQRGYEVVAVDLAPDMIGLAEQYCSDEVSLRFVAADYEDLRYRNEFDAALFYDSLHHAENEIAALSSVYRALKPEGICLTVEPGAGHADAAQTTVQRFGVTEKDMPPNYQIKLGRRIGFREFRVYPRPDVYPVVIEPATGSAVGRYLKAMVRNFAKGLLGPGWLNRHWLHQSHIVWMRK